jgi:hypothetical protein
VEIWIFVAPAEPLVALNAHGPRAPPTSSFSRRRRSQSCDSYGQRLRSLRRRRRPVSAMAVARRSLRASARPLLFVECVHRTGADASRLLLETALPAGAEQL